MAQVILSIPRVTVPAMILAIIWQVGESAVPVVTGTAIDRALATGDVEQLVLWIAALAALYVALTTAARLTNRLNVYALQLLQHRLRTTLSVRVLHPTDTTGRAPDGDVVSTMTNDVTRLTNGVLLTTMAVSRIVSIVFIAVSLLAVHWLLGVLVLVGAPTVVWLMGILSRRLSRSTRQYQELLATTVGRAGDLIAGYRVIKGIRAEAEATRRYERASQETLAGARLTAGLLGRFQVVSGLVTSVFVATVTGLAGWFAIDGQLSIGGLITTVGLAQALLPQIEAFAGISIPNFATAHASAARILDLLVSASADGSRSRDDHRCDESTPPPAPDAIDHAGPLDVRVSGTSVTVEPGELVGVRADDRTSARLADALLDPHATSGTGNEVTVLLGGRPADTLVPQLYHSRIAVAPHRTTLFTGTIRDNLTMATAAPERIDAAVTAAACEDFVTDLDILVGENGNHLSGGQRQRVALARALVADAPLLVLHDPTTAVDSVTEQVIADRLPGNRIGRSTLLITSSPALLGCCDRVIDLTADDPVSEPAASAGRVADLATADDSVAS